MHHPLYRSEAFAEDLLEDTPSAPPRELPDWVLPVTVLLLGLLIGWVR